MAVRSCCTVSKKMGVGWHGRGDTCEMSDSPSLALFLAAGFRVWFQCLLGWLCLSVCLSAVDTAGGTCETGSLVPSTIHVWKSTPAVVRHAAVRWAVEGLLSDSLLIPAASLDERPAPLISPRTRPLSSTHSPANPHLTRIRAPGQLIPRRDAQIQVSLLAPHARVRDDDLDDVPAAADAEVRAGARVGEADAAAAERVAAEGRADGGEQGAVCVDLAAAAVGAGLVVDGRDVGEAGGGGGVRDVVGGRGGRGGRVGLRLAGGDCWGERVEEVGGCVVDWGGEAGGEGCHQGEESGDEVHGFCG